MAQKNEMVQIAGTVGGISVAIVAVIVVFAKQHVWVAVPVVGALALMGIVLGAMAARKPPQGDPPPPPGPGKTQP